MWITLVDASPPFMSVAAARSFKCSEFESDTLRLTGLLQNSTDIDIWKLGSQWDCSLGGAIELHKCNQLVQLKCIAARLILTWNGQMIFRPRRCIMVHCLFFSIQLISKSLCTKRPLWKHIQVNLMQSHFCWSNEVRECQGWGPCHQNKTRNSPSTWEKSV